MASQPTIVQNIAHYGHGDIYAQQNAGAQKVDGSWLMWPAVILIGGSAVAGLAVEAFAIGAMLAPFVVGGAATVGATWAGIKGVTVLQRRLLKQAAAQPAPLLLCPEALEMAARLIDRGAKLNEYDLAALERVAQKAKQCASLPESQPLQPSAALPLPMQSSL